LYLGVDVIPVIFLFIGLLLVGWYLLRNGYTKQLPLFNREEHKKVLDIQFDDIGGQEHAKQELQEALDFLLQRKAIQSYGIRPIKGILLSGPPGTGKTLMAKAAAHYTDSIFISVAGSEFI